MLDKTVFALFLFVAMITSGLARTEDTCELSEKELWSYDSRLGNGPRRWGKKYPSCFGNQQSPVDLSDFHLSYLKGLKFGNYGKPITKATVENNGYTVVVTPQDNVTRSLILSKSNYSLTELHFHWGTVFYEGSEHTVKKEQFAMELHLVHENREGKTAVVGVLYEQNRPDNKGLQPIVNSLDKILYKGMKMQVNHPIDLRYLVDKKCSFYRYIGSLTTPPCTEGVLWSICKKVKRISTQQINVFRKLYSYAKKDSKEDLKECKISNNFRETQPLKGRTIYKSL